MSFDPNLTAVEAAVEALGKLADDFLLIGGCAVGLLVTEPAVTSIRPTTDVDMLTEATPLSDYYALCARLKERGFREDQGDVICRWIKDSIIIDVVPADEAILGFTNTWYAPAAQSSNNMRLPSGKHANVISAPYFLATKLEAFASRGNGDFMHHDMEDIVTVIDGRASIIQEVIQSDTKLRSFLQDEFEALLANATFIERLPWLISPNQSNARHMLVLERLQQLAGF
ncbi:hypothetical protein [Allopusillimonas ginsengisoli]|uniref:hypothetical protein n=1 Tax=Allopusillimonas ginsengisoli TaxID=453575 RepID=UPI0010219D86|nr:hypothetical protein [Allopusillimonas ginsengisoli]TEA79927.1 hypothetical protein ERE07_03055 [Allopusillimonas ginsengisoli]